MIVGINGFGRIGKIVYKILRERKYKVPLINDPFLDVDKVVYMLTYDSVTPRKHSVIPHGKCASRKDAGTFTFMGGDTALTNCRSPADIPWREYNVDVVIEASGVHTKKDACQGHIDAGARRVVVTAPSKDIKMIVMGVNEHTYNGETIVSNASCTTNCLAPLVKVIDDAFTVVEGLMTTIHATTATQRVVDGVSGKDMRLGRSASNIIPSSTGAADVVARVLPSVHGKLTGMAFRVPVQNVSVVDLTVRVEKECTLDDITERVKEAASGAMKGILSYTDEPVVSADINGDTHSSVYDIRASIQLNKTFFKIVSWYDNEYGYSCRVADLAEYVWQKDSHTK